MQYSQIVIGDMIIEFHNSWTGEETVIVNGQVVSKKSSVWGTNHYFSLTEDGEAANYVLTSRINENLQVRVDLSRNGKIIREDIPVKYGSRPHSPHQKMKKQGLAKLQEYDLEGALEDFEKALPIAPKDPELHFHMACAYSVQERPREGFEALKKAVEHRLQDTDAILNHDMLAFLRMHPAFESFRESGYRAYDEELLDE